ncbi:PAS domain S-box protein [Pontiellaceae bacterium B12227]|nr:PAS domain S-box protein [Pontiellaceae bacterium B12227]
METYEELECMQDAPVIVADHNGLICSINRCFAETFNWKEEQLVGNLLTDIMPAKYRDSHSMGISRFLTTESRTLPEHALNLDVLCGDGTPLKSSHTIVAGKKDGKWRFAGKIVPLAKDGQ